MIAMSVLTRALGFGPINKKLVTRLVVLGLLTSVSTLAVAVSTADVTLAGGGVRRGGGGGGGGVHFGGGGGAHFGGGGGHWGGGGGAMHFSAAHIGGGHPHFSPHVSSHVRRAPKFFGSEASGFTFLA